MEKNRGWFLIAFLSDFSLIFYDFQSPDEEATLTDNSDEDIAIVNHSPREDGELWCFPFRARRYRQMQGAQVQNPARGDEGL